MNSIPQCPICNSLETKCFLRRLEVPVHQNLLMKSQKSAQSINRGDLSLYVCTSCGFVFNTDFDLAKMNYSSEYNNSQTYSPFFEQYVNGLVQRISEEVGDTDCTVIEIGCGKGDFLKRIVQTNPNVKGFGFDPSYEGDSTYNDGRLTFIKEFYDANYAHINADIVICRHVIEHVETPVQLLSTVRQALISSANTKLFFETPCVDWILENQVYWDFFYEHCSYFTKSSLTTAFERAGFQAERITHIFNGQYLWMEATLGDVKDTVSVDDSKRTYQLAERFTQNEFVITNKWKTTLQTMELQGSIAVWGAGAKGVTIANLLDPECKLISCIVDINPAKQGKYLPGTGHPIVGVTELEYYNISDVVVMNLNYRDEIASLLQQHNIKVNLIELETHNENNH
ncbi:class I SAM-dependent methyltransferase [Paenibacillus whitsoniae]|uniref:Methyltransferase domain-containing protein n=1 Tax=Paenibacillus whitsoniae TaxID=2496558 RepID=A0A430JA64_9BACL|nr:class I SAM-dependent methyltransferase [Paenibacillus whitsoniae]RTE07914.1 methyltransferase domain-containing protein [Paenibacillus whitsoniae]